MIEAERMIPPQLGRIRRPSLAIGISALALSTAGAFFSPAQFFRSYLVGYMFWIGIALGCLGIAMLHHLTGGKWGLVIRRPLDSGAKTLWLMAPFFVPLVFGLRELYTWARPDEVARSGLLLHKRPYLNVPFFLARATVYFAAWIAMAHFLSKWSRALDRQPGRWLERRLRLLSGPGLVLYGLTVTFASVDWVMSLQPEWFSTIFGLLLIGGQALSAMAFAIIAIVLLAREEPMSRIISPKHLHDLGTLLLAFVMLWAYLSFSQLLIIWSGNLPEEAVWYVYRLHGGWRWIAVSLLILYFFLPFLLLLSRFVKRSAALLLGVAVGVIAMRFVDLFWLIVPAFHGEAFHFHWLDLAALIGLGGIWLAFFAWQLEREPLVPLHGFPAEEATGRGGE